MMDASHLGTLYQSLQRAVGKYPDRSAYAVPPMAGRSYHPDGWEVTWAQTSAAVEAKRKTYRRAGYGLGHRVAMLFDQRPEFFFHYYALNALGVSVVPINPDYRRDEIRYVLEHSEASLCLAIDARADDVRSVCEPLGVGYVSFDRFPDVLPAPRTEPGLGEPSATTEAALLYTSGTTGRPKGCILTNEYFHTFGSCYLSLGGRLAMRNGEERLFNPLPLHHANCLSVSAPAMLISGGCLIFPDRFHASTWWKELVATRATAVQFQGVIPNILLKLPPCPEDRAHQVRFALCAGIEPSQHEVFEQRFGFPVVEMWAMSETGRLISDNHEPRKIHTRAFGRTNAWVEARVVDDQGNEVAPDVQGELVIRHSAESPRKGFFSGYLKNPEATEEAWRGGWFHTGDAVVRDAQGMLYFLDRKKNIIRRSGENIAAAEVEACLTAHPKVKQVAVLAAPDEVREEEVMACVIARAEEDVANESSRNALAQELFAWCFERMAYFKAPGWMLFVDSLPTGTSAKVQKIHIFPAGVDPRKQAGAIDLRAQKKHKQPSAR
ncbi:MAG TPA: AMP-binding protein [Burkholderiales bacterium]|nr:AMP-binding protein [Burkholderiales bacterium]